MSNHNNIKHVMRIALVGIKPADQVMLKGYLRVLLRLEADLEWVSANHPHVDMFMINNDFRNSANIIKLLQSQVDKPILYISKSTNDISGLDDNILTLPLKKTELLSNWLYKNVEILGKKQTTSETNNKLDANGEAKQPNTSSLTFLQTNVSNMGCNQESSIKLNSNNHKSSNVLQVIQSLRNKEFALLQVITDNKLLAVVEPNRSLVWVDSNNAITPLSLSSLIVRVYLGQPPAFEKPVNLKQWLWDISWNNSDDVSVFIDDNTKYQLQCWPKPSNITDRRELVRVFTALEKKPITIADIVNITGATQDFIRKVLASLLFSGCLKPLNYLVVEVEPLDFQTKKSISHQSLEENKTVITHKNSPEPQTVDTILSRRVSSETPTHQVSSLPPLLQTNNQSTLPEKKGEIGFLARLRNRLGL